MLSVPGLKTADETIGPLQSLTAPFVAPGWASRPAPFMGEYRSTVYAAALDRLKGNETRLRVALALLWSDADVGQYSLRRIPMYQEAFLGTPNDERAAFFITALCIAGLVTEESVRARAFAAVLRPEWQKSLLWERWGLSASDLTFDLARQYAAGIEGGSDCAPYALSPARVTIVEAAWAMASGTAERDPYAAFLARAYRSQERRDDRAESVYRHVFSVASEDRENTEYLARLYASEAREDFAAYMVYAHAASHAEAAKDFREERKWTIRAARAGARLGRCDRATQTALERAVIWEPDDLSLLTAHGQVMARFIGEAVSPTGTVEADEANRAALVLEPLYGREAELLSVFASRGGNFEAVVRGVAVAWAAQERSDTEACQVYTRAAATFTAEDRGVWLLLSRACAAAGEDSPEALRIYEQAVGNRDATQLEKPLLNALAQAYVRAEAWEGARRAFALTVWERVHQRKEADSAMIAALARAYEADLRSTDSSIAVWKQTVEAEPKNGELRLRLAQELRSRGEHDQSTLYYKEAARLLPRSFIAQYEAALQVREHDSRLAGTAVRYLQKAVKLPEGRNHREGHFALGELLLGSGKRAEAETIFQKIIDEIDAHHAPTLLHLAKLNLRYEEEGSRRAESLYEQAVQAAPEHPETYRKMAEMYRERGQAHEEEQALERYLTLSEPDAERFRHLADLYLRRGDHVRAEGALRQVIALGQADKQLYTLLGEVIIQARGAKIAA